jgi:hypothetical protein
MKQPNELLLARTTWNGRSGYALENGVVRLVTLTGGGHIAEFRFTDSSGRPTINPMWVPPWKTIEPHRYRPQVHTSRYGPPNSGGKLLSGLVGHSICLDLFGSPSEEEIRRGYPFHGEAPNLKWHKIDLRKGAAEVSLKLFVSLRIAGLELEREIRLCRRESAFYVRETVNNLKRVDHFCHWVEHVTLGPTILSNRDSMVYLPGTLAMTYPHNYEEGKCLLATKQEFKWPSAPAIYGGYVNLTRPFLRLGRGFVVGVLLNPNKSVGYVAALNFRHRLLLAYSFRRGDFPWVAIWEENKAKVTPPWRKKAQARGLEFGTTPFALPRREAFSLGNMFGTPTLACIPARGKITREYVAFLVHLPDRVANVADITLDEKEILVHCTSPKGLLHVPAQGLRGSSLLQPEGT